MKIELVNVTKQFNKKNILENLNLKIEDHNIIAIIGPSGAGKSTILRMMAGLEDITSGQIKYNEQEINQLVKDKRIGFVFQSNNLFPHLSVIENITIVLERVHHIDFCDAYDQALQLLKKFGLGDHINKKPHQISGGQAQRVAIVRALAIDYDLILLDEPTSALDPLLTYEVLTALEELKNENKNMIVVTHEIGFAEKIADYVVYIENNQIVEHGPSSILKNPQTKELAYYLSKVFKF